MFSKRGQEGITIGTLLLIVLGIAVVVVIILGATGGLNFIFDKFQSAPLQNLQAAVTSCNLAGERELKADFCSTFREVELDGKTQFVTCVFLKVENLLDNTKIKETCTDVSQTQVARDYCGTAASGKKDDVWVNGAQCKNQRP